MSQNLWGLKLKPFTIKKYLDPNVCIKIVNQISIIDITRNKIINYVMHISQSALTKK